MRRPPYRLVRVSVSVLVAEPAGVSTRVVEDVRDFSVVVPDLPASMFTLVDELDGGEGCSMVVEDELGAEGAGCTIVVEELAGGASLAGGSFTTVVDEFGAGRSHPARAAIATAARGSAMNFMEVSIVH